jgi:hypothetical protein
MSASARSTSNNCVIPIAEIYTGTADTPDVVSIFLKSGRKPVVKIEDEQITNALGYSPLEFLSAIPRIGKAAKILFQELARGTCFNRNSEFWNAFKNFSRGIVQLVPLIGNAALYLHDLARTTFSIHPKINAALSNQQQVLGIAFDGKPVFTIPISTVKSRFDLEENTDKKEVLAVVQYAWAAIKQRAIKDRSRSTTRELALQLHQFILDRRFANSASH